MKYHKILIFGLILLSIPSLVFSTQINSDYNQECKLAYPMMEVLKCETGDSKTENLEFFQNTTSRYWYTEAYTCISECNADITLTRRDTSWAAEDLIYQIFIDGQSGGRVPIPDVAGLRFDDISERTQRQFSEGQEFKLITNADTRSVDITDKNKYLYATNHEWSSNQLQNTQNCLPQNRVYSLVEEQIGRGNLPSVYYQGGIDAIENQVIEPQGKFVDLSNYNLNTELKVGDTISYFYRWTEVPDINLRYDNRRDAVYCGGSSTNRKLIGYNAIETRGGECYNVPSNKIRDVECCYDGDCALTGEICGVNFQCTTQKPCNSDFECGTQDNQCKNKQLTTWSCDISRGSFNLPNGETYQGWCREEKKPVLCCEENCGAGYHCNYTEGCIKDIHWLACSGDCCLSNGDYVPKECNGGLTCCTVGGSLVGECKEVCEPIIFEEDYFDSCNEGFTDLLSTVRTFIPGAAVIADSIETLITQPCEEELIENGEPSEENPDSMFDNLGVFGNLLSFIFTLF